MYKKSDFAKDLQAELLNGYDITRLARWAFELYLEKCSAIELEAKNAIMEIVVMEEGPEFEMTLAEIEKLIRKWKYSN